MAFAVELFLEREDASLVHAFWRHMEEERIGLPMYGRAHITLCVWDTLDLDAAAAWLEAFARTVAPFPVRFASLGVFANNPAVMFLAPVVTPHLLDLQARLGSGLPADPAGKWSYYQPGWWVPHCTLAMELDHTAFPRAIEHGKQVRLPYEARLDAIGIVEFPVLTDHVTIPLTGVP